MKIVSVASAVLAVPTPRPMSLEIREHRLVVAHVHTDEGLSGLGYSLAFGGGGAEAVQVYLETRLGPLLVGEDPRLVERLWEHLAAAHQVLVSPHVVHELSIHVAGALANGFLVEYMDWMPPDLFVDVPRPDAADGLIAIPERPGHGMALAPGAERKYRPR
jgi:L-alanine-DL-glutamate epimerase-like enolase superfamily enzyme